jgi:hypothetical protein
LKPTPTPVTFNGDERIELNDCYVFRDGLAHKAKVAIASAVSFTDLPHLLHIDVVVPGSKKMTLGIGISYPEVMRMIRHSLLWNDALSEYDSCKLDVVSNLFEKYEADLTAAPWTEEDIQTVRDLETIDEMQMFVKNDLLRIAAVAMEKQDV